MAEKNCFLNVYARLQKNKHAQQMQIMTDKNEIYGYHNQVMS